MRGPRRWARRLLTALVVLVLLLLAPVGWTEIACRGTAAADDYAAILPPEHRRDESRTYTTYPEWHIVHAYEDYARVIASGDPHEFGYLRAIRGFWSSLCPLARSAAAHGGFTAESKMTIYTIGVSFTAELLAKAAYEETLGRVATWIRGAGRAPLDELSAEQAARYANFLRQTPWYRWDFDTDARALRGEATGAFRDRERRFALGFEYRAKAAYARAIERAVAAVGADSLELRSLISGLSAEELDAIDGVTVVRDRPEGIEIETPRYRAFTRIAEQIAAEGGVFAEIAGNDDILVTVLSSGPAPDGTIATLLRQGAGDRRYLVELKVADLSEFLGAAAAGELRIEHIHDY